MSLEIVEIDGTKFYKDERLREYRQVTHTSNVIKYEDIGERVVKPVESPQSKKTTIKRKLQ